MIASQEFERLFILSKEEKDKLYAIKKPNILVTWNLDNGIIIKNTILKGRNYDKY
jgi:hypothetical protein